MSSPLLPYVTAESACLQSFLTELEDEERAMSEGRFADLPTLGERKRQLLARIAEIDCGRESMQLQLGLEAGRAGAEAAASGDEGLRGAWTKMLVLAARAQELNRRVAAKVHAHLEFTAGALAFLQTRDTPLYDRDGARRSYAPGVSIALG